MVELTLKRTQYIGTKTDLAPARLTKLSKMLVALAVMLAVTTCMYGSPITGSAFVGSAEVGVGGNTPGTAFIDFFSTQPLCNVAGIGTLGCFTVQTGTGNFVTGSTATVQDLTSANDGGNVSGPTPITSWAVFSFGVVFDLTNVLAGSGADCATFTAAQLAASGTTCTPHVGAQTGPFTLTNGPGNTLGVQFSVNANGYTGTSVSGTSTVVGIFSTQFTNSSIASLLTTLGTGGEITNTYSATFTAANAVPEPGTMYFFCGGTLLLVPMMLRRRLRKK